jgi:hypothetical protein
MTFTPRGPLLLHAPRVPRISLIPICKSKRGPIGQRGGMSFEIKSQIKGGDVVWPVASIQAVTGSSNRSLTTILWKQIT